MNAENNECGVWTDTITAVRVRETENETLEQGRLKNVDTRRTLERKYIRAAVLSMWAPFPVSALRVFTDRIYFYSICVWCVAARLCEIKPKNCVRNQFFLNFFWFDNFYFIFIRYKYDFFTQIYEASYRLCEYNNKKYSCQRILFGISRIRTGVSCLLSFRRETKMEGRNVVIKTVKKTKQWHQNIK